MTIDSQLMAAVQTLGEIRGELSALTAQTRDLAHQVAVQNGSVRDVVRWQAEHGASDGHPVVLGMATRAVQWQARHDLDDGHQKGIAEGRLIVRVEDRARAAFVLRLLQSEYVRLGLLAGAIGAIAGWWPW